MEDAWIRTLGATEARGELAEIYRRFGVTPGDELDNILKVHGLHPSSLNAHYAVYRAAMTGTDSLPRSEREMIAVAVSTLNGCHY